MNNTTNTYQGDNVEHLFANSIQDHPRTFNCIKESLDVPSNAKVANIERVGGNKRKSDVDIVFKNNAYPTIKVSIKSFTDTGYNHIERRRLGEFCKRNQIRKDDANFLIKIWLRKARNSKRDLVDLNERARVRAIFSSIEPAASALLGNDHPQILALFSVTDSKWKIYNMVKDVIPLTRNCTIGFTSRSSNITIGKYIVIQRKGSAKEAGSDPYSIEHRSNDVQLKMKVKQFFNKVEPIAWYQL